MQKKALAVAQAKHANAASAAYGVRMQPTGRRRRLWIMPALGTRLQPNAVSTPTPSAAAGIGGANAVRDAGAVASAEAADTITFAATGSTAATGSSAATAAATPPPPPPPPPDPVGRAIR